MFFNLENPELKKRALKEGSTLLKSGALVTQTSPHTGRSAKAKFYVIDETTKSKIDWRYNESISPDVFENQVSKFIARKNSISKPVYRQFARAVRDKRRSINVEFYTEFAVHAMFVNNMFIPEKDSEKIDFSVYHFPSLSQEPKVLISLKDKIALISGTLYSGEIKKTIFSVLNYYFPEREELPMHCSANMSLKNDNVAIFFGLSGTGKTTLSSDKNRVLIGDDEHGWTSDGITNFEGGCYAKTYRLNKDAEPQIWEACHGDSTLLENVVHKDGLPDFDCNSISENARASYPFHYISNSCNEGFIDKHPKNIIMLTCDAFGVLPPVSKLNSEEASRHFLLGYTAKIAGTEVGVSEPTATFSPCFGMPFMPLSPEVYGSLLKKKILEHKTDCWLVNTGWIGGPYGEGERISIGDTRKIINSILDGSLAQCKTIKHAYTGMNIPLSNKIDESILIPEKSWKSIERYSEAVKKLNQLFLNKESEPR